MPWGGSREGGTGTTLTDYGFTGQRRNSYIKLVWFGSRWYDSYLNRWTSPDTIIPNPNDPLSFDRYSYTRNNPINFVDPTGHDVDCAITDDTCKKQVDFENNVDEIITFSGVWNGVDKDNAIEYAYQFSKKAAEKIPGNYTPLEAFKETYKTKVVLEYVEEDCLEGCWGRTV